MNQTLKGRKAILYVRVSTDEQAEKGHSLAHQEDKLRSYCAFHDIEIVGFYKEDHSAKSFERPEFRKILQFLKTNKRAADMLLFLRWDRFSRNAPDAYAMIAMLGKLGIESQAAEQPLDLSIPENKFMLAFYLTAGEVENDRRSLNVIAGMRRALKEGRWVWAAPVGYRNARGEDNKPCVQPSKDAPVVRWAFEQLSTGAFSMYELWKAVRKKGLRVSRNGFQYMVANRFYTGNIFVPAYKDEPEMVVKGIHEPLISEALFRKVQSALKGASRAPRIANNTTLDGIALRGFLQCSRCGRIMTGGGSRGNGGTYYYYSCTGGCKERIKAPIVNTEVEKMIAGISGNSFLLDSFEAIMSEHFLKEGKEKKGDLARIETEMATLTKRLDQAQTLMLDGQIEASDYRSIKAKIEPEILRLTSLKEAKTEPDPNYAKMISEGFDYLRNLPKAFTSAALPEKQRLLGSIFPEKIVFSDGKVRTNEEDNILMLLSQDFSGLGPKKKSPKKIFGDLTNGVGPPGLEPGTL